MEDEESTRRPTDPMAAVIAKQAISGDHEARPVSDGTASKEMEAVAVVIPASGVGRRSGRELPKQFVAVNGQPLLYYTISSFHRLPYVKTIVVTIMPEWKDHLQKLVDKEQLFKVVIADGDSKSRHLSIRNGLAVLADKSYETIVIQDAVRPFLLEPVLRQVIGNAKQYGASGVVVPCTSTVLLVDEGNFLDQSLVRNQCRRSEMPQAFSYRRLMQAYRNADEHELIHGTEVLNVYRLGNPTDRIAMVESTSHLHWKVTYPEDFHRAKLILDDLSAEHAEPCKE